MEKNPIEKKVDKIAKEVLKHSDILKNVATKSDLNVVKQDVSVLKQDVSVLKQDVKEIKTDFSEFKNETLTRLDKIIAVQEKHEQERIFAYEQVKRHDEQIEKHTKEIKEIKEVLHIG